ncbi:MAG TPA: hypothetical protein IGS17_05680 [Oscillatoriales cyanobacterium M59_W2019_021]|nr:MAG: hypothetical protein D6728_08655 [Cyanobacteria bacterium J055]HIK32329.1 hypothetical protein [Oscillatoriales cyanobacterium M4454_W2019_049]HIK50402.1 hypothetical protein [Oscillatoriales cyanobacterium M59_W2019_021]
MRRAIPSIAILLVSLFSFSFSVPDKPLICREENAHQICIFRIKRSAKNYWEYRAWVSIDDRPRPMETYNCRDRSVMRSDGTRVSFGAIDPIDVVCSFFEKLSRY